MKIKKNTLQFFQDAFSKGNKFFYLGIAFTTAVIRIKIASWMQLVFVFFLVRFGAKIHSEHYHWVAFKYHIFFSVCIISNSTFIGVHIKLISSMNTMNTLTMQFTIIMTLSLSSLFYREKKYDFVLPW